MKRWVGGRWRSIDRKLPLLISGLLLGAVGAFSWAAHETVQRVLLASAGVRLQNASAPVGLLLEQSATRYRAELMAIARDPAVLQFLATRRDTAGARKALAGVWAEPGPHRGRIELRGTDGAIVLDTSRGTVPPGSGWIDRTIASGALIGGEPLVGPFRTAGDSTYAESMVAVAGGGGTRSPVPASGPPRVLGYVVDLNYLAAQGAPTIRGLIGPHTRILLGVPSEGAWTNLEHPAAPPPRGIQAGRTLLFASSHGDGVGAAVAIRGTSWVFWVEQPQATVLAPMRQLGVQMAVWAGLVLVLGVVGAWVLSRGITRPIVSLTEAAEHIAAAASPAATAPGPSAADGAGQDEVSRLADAFQRMSARVTESRQELERRVAERTARLQDALGKLEAAQGQLVQKERLAMLGQLASAVGHELRNPLGVMTNALYVIDHGLPDAPPMVREYLGLLRGQIAVSERIVGDLLDTARVRSPQVMAVELPAIVETQILRLGPLDGVTVRQEFPPGLPCAAVDPAQLAQILLNLFSNAVQAMGDSSGGTLTIAGSAAPDGTVRLTVADSGPGMPPDILERIFEPLFTTKARGLGLGLWVSRTLASANGGTLEATSRPGEGARFVLAMPTATRAWAQTAAAQGAAA